MSCSVNYIIEKARSFVGVHEGSKVHHEIIDAYNKYKPVSEYTMTYSDPWCAAFIGAVAGMCGAGDIIPISASCDRMIKIFKNMDEWYTSFVVPEVGDILFYDWDGNGSGDHVGIIAEISGNNLLVVEGNMSDAVGLRTINMHDKCILGFGAPCYGGVPSTEPVETPADEYSALSDVDKAYIKMLPTLFLGSKGIMVKLLQRLLNDAGYELEEDGDFGPKTQKAVYDWQKTCCLEIDGICGCQTWASLIA